MCGVEAFETDRHQDIVHLRKYLQRPLDAVFEVLGGVVAFSGRWVGECGCEAGQGICCLLRVRVPASHLGGQVAHLVRRLTAPLAQQLRRGAPAQDRRRDNITVMGPARVASSAPMLPTSSDEHRAHRSAPHSCALQPSASGALCPRTGEHGRPLVDVQAVPGCCGLRGPIDISRPISSLALRNERLGC